METTRPSETGYTEALIEKVARAISPDAWEPEAPEHHREFARDQAESALDALELTSAYDDRDAALERLGVVLAERDQLARLHEVATERVVGYAAVIEQAKAAIGTENEWDGHGRADQLDNTRRALASADTDAALREVRATARDQCAYIAEEKLSELIAHSPEWWTVRDVAEAIRRG